jgi:hypothetical protein
MIVKNRPLHMNTKELEVFAKEAVKGIKTPQDLNNFSRKENDNVIHLKHR